MISSGSARSLRATEMQEEGWVVRGIDSILPLRLAFALDEAAAYGLPGMCWEPCLLPRYGNFRLERQLLCIAVFPRYPWNRLVSRSHR